MTQMIPSRRPATNAELTRQRLDLADAGRAMGIWVLGTRGSGKSRLVGRMILWNDFIRSIPIVCFDPIGGTIQNILDKILRIKDPRQQHAAFQRVRYINVAGTASHVVPLPLLYEAKSSYYAAQRFIEVVRRTDTDLTRNPQLGLNAIRDIGTDVGMVLYAMGWQLTEAEAFLRDPRAYATQVADAEKRYPEIQPAAERLLREYPELRPQEKQMLTGAYLRKLSVLNRESSLRAILGADTPGIRWDEVVEKRRLVLLDFSHVAETDQQFMLLWWYRSLIEWIRLSRGIGRHPPLSLILDELTYMVGNRHDTSDMLAQDINRFVSINSRNAQIWMTILNQEMNQLSPDLQDTLFTLGTQIYGVTSDYIAAQRIAQRFAPYVPKKLKDREEQWATATIDNGPFGRREREDYVRSHRNVYLTIQEQLELNSRRILELPRSTFLVGVSTAEGSLPTSLQHISIANLDRDPVTGQPQYPDEQRIAEAQDRLMRRDGRPIQQIRDEIARRTAATADAAGSGGATQRRRMTPIAKIP